MSRKSTTDTTPVLRVWFMFTVGVVLILAFGDQVFGCTCCNTFPNGKSFDLDALTRGPSEAPWKVTLNSGVSFLVNFCAKANSPCAASAAVCMNNSGNFLSAGSLSPAPKWNINPNGGVQLVYAGGAKCPSNNSTQLTTVINVLCSTGTGTFVGGSQNGCQYQLQMKSQYGCAISSTTTGTSGGSNGGSNSGDSGSDSSSDGSESGFPKGGYFLIAFFVLFGVYFIGGSAIRKWGLHKEGSDIVPQVEFWKDLPFLIKDGFVWSFRKIFQRGHGGEHSPLIP